MFHWRHGLALFLTAVLAGTTRSQAPLKDPLPAKDPAPAAATPETMAEHVEIMRRLLVRNVTDWQRKYLSIPARMGPTAAVATKYPNYVPGLGFPTDGKVLAVQDPNTRVYYSPGPGGASVTGFLSVEGAYLPTGAVFFVSMAPFWRPADASPNGKPATAGQTTAWEEVRRQLHGEKPERKTQSLPRPTVTEIVLRTLADNGKHFTRLKADESLTVVITFREPEPGTEKWFFTEAVPGPNIRHELANPSKAKDYVLLADLKLKQRNAQVALQALEKAIQLERDHQTLAELYRKAAQALLMMNQDEAARKAIEKAAEYAKSKGLKAGTAASLPLPPQLVIAATKSVLDQVAAGKISYGEFRRSAKVEMRNAR
jgi:hypothetical protein